MKRIIVLAICLLSFYYNMQAQQKKTRTIYDFLGVTEENCRENSKSSHAVSSVDEIDDPVVDSTTILKNFATLKTKRKDLKRLLQNALNNKQLLKSWYNDDNEKSYLLYYKNGLYTIEDPSGKEYLKDSFFYFKNDFTDHYGANLYKNKQESKYYRYDGKLLFDEKFDYVEPTNVENYFLVYKNGKAGICDSTGTLIIPTNYKKVEAFKTKGKIYFAVDSFSTQYYKEYKSNKILSLDKYCGTPGIIADNIWDIWGTFYNPVTEKYPFCNIDKEIKVADKKNGVLYIEEKWGSKFRIYFDINGKLLTDNYAYIVTDYEGSLNEKAYVVVLPDTTGSNQNQKNNATEQYICGLANSSMHWLIKPSDYYLEKLNDSICLYTDRKNGKYTMGLVTFHNKIVATDTGFTRFGKAYANNLVVAIKDSLSFLYDVNTKKYIHPLPNLTLQIDETGVPDIYKILYTKTKDSKYGSETLVDSNGNRITPFGYSHINYADYDDLFNGYGYLEDVNDHGYEEGGRLSGYYHRDGKQIEFIINNKVNNQFLSFNKLRNDIYEFTTLDSSNYIAIKQKIIPLHIKGAYSRCRYETGLNVITEDDKTVLYIYDTTGNPITTLPASFIEKETIYPYLTIGTQYSQQICNKEGEILFNGEYESVEPLTENYFIVMKKGLKGIVDVNNKIKLSVQYKEIEVEKGGIWYGDTYSQKKLMSIIQFK